MKKYLTFLLSFGISNLIISNISAEPITKPTSNPQVIEANKNFQVKNYVGTWYEVARLPTHFERNCQSPITDTYQLNDNGELDITHRCKLSNGEFTAAHGLAAFTEESDIAKFKVSFVPGWLRWTHLGNEDYWVLYTDYTHFALVGSPDRETLWILSRNEDNSKEDIQKLIDLAHQYNYPVQNLIFSTQSFKLY